MTPESKANILIVDDRPDQLMVLEAALADLHENTVAAQSGQEALRHLKEQKFAVILLDINMPGMDGFETAKLIRQDGGSQDTPIIFVTAYGQTGTDLARCYSLGAVDYVLTPVVPEILRTKVGVFVELHKKTHQVEQQADELRQRLKELTDINRELESLSYSLSHDLRAIHNFTTVVLEDCGEKIGLEGAHSLKRVVSAAARMERLLQGLLALSTVSRCQLRFRLIDVEGLLREIIGERPELQPPRAEITIEGPLSSMRGDEASLTQCLTNLLSNAVKFVAPGTVPQVRIYGQDLGDKARLWIEDNGIGVPENAHDKVFEAFQRMPQARAYEGEGIGLAIVHKAVERMRGNVGVESKPGKGSRFWVELPALPDRVTRTA